MKQASGASPKFKKHQRPGASSRSPGSPLQGIQRTLGNRATQHFVQAQLTVSQPGDLYEEEADRVAEQVMRMPESSPAARIQRMCDDCEEELQREAAVEGEGLDERAGEIEPYVASLPGRGQPLPEATRAYMEPRFGADFSRVRVHTDSAAAQSARAVDALAFTVGRDIVFGAGSYAPESEQGRRLLSHELTHVIQQGEGREPAVPGIMRTALFSSTMESCHRLLKSRTFHVSKDGVRVKANAGYEQRGTPECSTSDYHITLTEKGSIYDSEYGTRDYVQGSPATHWWTDLPAGDYYLTIWTNNTNPYCCLVGDIAVEEQSGMQAEELPQFPYGAELDPELKARFNRMVIAMEKKAIRHDSRIDDVRPRRRAHILSTGYHIHTKQAVGLDALRGLKDGKDLDGNTWYDKKWETGKEGPATDEGILEKAKKNAFQLVEREGSKYLSGSQISCAYEGYEPDDERRKPNVADVPVSNHVTGGAIDLGGVEWDELGGKWSEEAVEFVASFGLIRPFSPEAATYCIKEHWHFELGAQAPAKEETRPEAGEPQ